MIYDPDLEKGVKKRLLPEPNPAKVELPKKSSLDQVISKAKDLYFKSTEFMDHDDQRVSFKLADSTGVTILIEDSTNWSLGEFYQQNGLVPSRFKLYVMAVFEVATCISLPWYIMYLLFSLACAKYDH